MIVDSDNRPAVTQIMLDSPRLSKIHPRIQTKKGESGHSRSAGGPRPQHVARSSWSGTFLSLAASYGAADRDGPRSGGGGIQDAPKEKAISRTR